MSFSPEQIAIRRFMVDLRGYDKDEVDAFLKEVGVQMVELLARRDGAVEAPGTNDDAFRQLGVQAAAEADASALLARATAEAQQVRQQFFERIQETLHELATVMDPSLAAELAPSASSRPTVTDEVPSDNPDAT